MHRLVVPRYLPQTEGSFIRIQTTRALSRQTLRQEPYEGMLQVRICAGGRRQRPSLAPDDMKNGVPESSGETVGRIVPVK